MTDTDFTDMVDRHFSIDGPHDADTIITALRSASQLLRYVAHATYPGKRHLAYGPQIYRAVGALNGLLTTAVQVADQVGGAAEDIAGDPTMFDDRRTPEHLASVTAVSAAVALRGEVVPMLSRALLSLERAHSLTCHLGHNQRP